MRPPNGFLVSIGVAGALLTSTLVLAQVEDAKVPEANEPEKKQPEAKKDEPNRADEEVAAVGIAADDPKPEELVEQFRPIFRVELAWIGNSCGLTKDQQTQVARAGERVITDAVTHFVEMERKNPQAQKDEEARSLELYDRIQERFSTAVKAHLTAEQQARFRVAVKTRAAYRKRVAVRNLVVWLDRELILSADQRRKLEESLSSHWNFSWCRDLETLLNGDPHFPEIPDEWVIPFLDPVQKRTWKELEKQQAGPGAGLQILMLLLSEIPLEKDEAQANPGER